MTTTTEPPAPEADSQARTTRVGDSIFSGLATAAGLLIMLALAGVAIFLILEGAPAITASGESLYGEDNIVVYVWPLLFGTLLAAILAMIIAGPLAIGIALVISHYAPRRVAVYLGYLIDLLAAVPSVVYGLWGRVVLAPAVLPAYVWLGDHLGWLPFFAPPVTHGRTILTASIVLAVMALPIITAICREVFQQTPRMHEEAALALGATRWEMVRMTVFPYSRSGVISAMMLGLGRALGETMAVAMVLSAGGFVTINLIGTDQPSTIAANIALNFGNASGSKINTLIFSGLVLFVVSFAVNFAGRWIASRGEVKA
ncbi:phosphate ABC transporter permease subunit PstC [Nocardioides sp. GY 10113]|uniref:phosphate ABC transporter permease subunit PstC n=1 Tax=Nocardioides sp. GY 10113 TaxID=2569761 RepID=UPI0010A8A9DB|nr:phosphate ABC transporter permease subunit PstC [Nocardioides sp. GY 10113]TIC88357.1 phosphate ABC transporter permease subunit PstC [Nocardioides sp. GY 10113]